MPNLIRSWIFIVVFFLVFLAIDPAIAQSTTNEPDTTTTSLTVGYLGNDLRLAGEDTDTPYDFGESMRMLMLSSDHGSLSVGYGSRSTNSNGNTSSIRVVDVFAMTGGNAYIVRGIVGLPIAAYVPIRFHPSYRYISVSGVTGPEDEELSDQHLANLGLGAGAGVWARLPMDEFPIIGDGLVVRASLVIAPGAYANLQENFETIYMSRTRDLNFEVKLERVLGGNLGVTLGYTRRRQSRTLEQPSSVTEVLDTVIGEGTLIQVSQQNVIRLGINW